MKKISVQYLIIFEVSSICSNIGGVENLLQINSDIKISGTTITYQSVSFEIELVKKLEDSENRYYQISFQSLEKNIEYLSELVREVRKLIQSNNGKIEILRDEISLYYAAKAYPLINKIENLMRKLITLFLIEGIGVANAKSAIPIELKKKTSNNFLHQTDFIHLGEILTKEYSNGNLKGLFTSIKKAKNAEELNLEYLTAFVPASNLDRYFKDYIDFDSDYLTKKWNRLYELRCIVAHNNFFKKNEYEELIKLIDEVKSKLKNAIDHVNDISIPENERESILEFTASNSNHLIGEFILKWKALEQKLYDFADLGERNRSVFNCLKNLQESGFLSKDVFSEFVELTKFRNEVVHLTEKPTSDEEILRYIESAIKLNKQLVMRKDFGDSWAFTIDKGVIENIKNSIIIRHRSTEYGLNGLATSNGYKYIDDIWKEDPTIEGAKISIGTFITIGNNL